MRWDNYNSTEPSAITSSSVLRGCTTLTSTALTNGDYVYTGNTTDSGVRYVDEYMQRAQQGFVYTPSQWDTQELDRLHTSWYDSVDKANDKKLSNRKLLLL